MIGLNVGSGQRPFDQSKGWINIDSVAHEGMPPPDLIADGAHLPYEDRSVDYVCLHHVLEHFGLGESDGLAKEAFRVLKPGGSMLVFVPDLRALAQRWLSGGLDTVTYMITLYGAYMGHDEDRHKFGYDRDFLIERLKATAAWSEVKDFNWRPIPGGDFARDFWILAVECAK
jgi:SAM-dependent methyltransferase